MDDGSLPSEIWECNAEYVVLVRHGAQILPRAIPALAAALARFPSEVAFGDGIEPVGRRRRVIVERPDFSPIRFTRQDDLGDVIVVRTEWGRRLQADTVGSLLSAADPRRVLHIPELLGRRRTPRKWERRDPETASTRRPLVSIVIPTRGSSADVRGRRRVLVVELIRAIIDQGGYDNFEFVVVADDETPQAVIDELVGLRGPIRLVRWSAPFNFASKVNRGVLHARGELILLLNDDIEPIDVDWLTVMVDLLDRSGVGIVGATLLYEDGTLQHAGHLYEEESASHVAHAWPVGRDDPMASLAIDREVSGVSAACAIVRREDFLAVGGMSSLFPGNYNDVDFCLKIRSTGLDIVITPRARLYHFESKTRDARVASTELDALRRRWRSRIEVDDYWPLSSGR